MQASPHAARWIASLDGDASYDVHVFGVKEEPPHAALRGVTLHLPERPPPPPPPGAPPPAPPLRRAVRFAGLLFDQPRRAASIAARKLRVPEPWPAATPAPPSPGLPFTLRRFVPEPALLPEDGYAFGARVPLGPEGWSAPALHAPRVLARVIEELKPDLVHALEFQHAGYLALAARDLLGADNFPPLLATNWGSDIYLYGRDPLHAPEIRRLLAAARLYSCECHRDVALAREFGFAGHVLPVLPNSGGMDLAAIAHLRNPQPPSARRRILVKGYEHFAGRAMRALDALERLAPRLARFEVALFLATAEPRARAAALAASGALDIRVLDWMAHEDMLAEFARARAYVGVSLSDAISTSVLEAMAMGAFPIQTNTSCCTEWFEDGAGGIAIPPDDPAALDAAILRAVSDDALVDRAAVLNRRVVEERLDQRVVRPKVLGFYAEAFAALG